MQNEDSDIRAWACYARKTQKSGGVQTIPHDVIMRARTSEMLMTSLRALSGS